MLHGFRSARVRVTLIGVLAAVAIGASACSPSEPVAPTSSAPTPDASPSPTAPSTPALVPDGTAADNLPYFTAVSQSVWDGPDQVHGQAYIDALSAAGFDRSAMQVTADQTTIGNPADSIEFSVLWHGECLVGQVGPEIGDLVTTVLPEIGGGICLVGQTRPIDG